MLGLIALPLLALAASPQAGNTPDRVRATGSASVYATADVASVSMYAAGQGPDEATAEGALEAVREAWSRAARPFARDPKDLTQGETSRSLEGGGTVLGGETDAVALRTYRARGGVTVANVDLGRLIPMFKAVSGIKGADAVSVSFSVRDAEALRKRAAREAFLDARRKAQDAAEAAGMRLADPYLIDAGIGASLVEADRSNAPFDPTKPLGTRRIMAVAGVQVEFHLIR